jgi:hypothetical protein
MDDRVREALDGLQSGKKELQNQAFVFLMDATGEPVAWAYEIWDTVLYNLSHKDNRVRAISSQVLCNLAKSDPEKRMLHDLDTLLEVTKDERFVTARHCLQSLWKIGMAGPEQRKKLVAGLGRRFRECSEEKNCTLIRFDITRSLRSVYDKEPDESVRQTALALIETEPDPKYRKKYLSLWRK